MTTRRAVRRVVVAGAGLAAVEVARGLRARGYAGSVVLVGAERHLPYDRPPLSKALLRREVDATTYDVDWADLGVELRLGVRAVGIADGALRTEAGDVPYDRLVVATGSVARGVPGEAPTGTVLRTLDDALALREALRPGARVVVVGAGWIGAEVATAAAAAGCVVTALEVGPEPLSALPPEVGARTRPWWSEAGADLRTGALVDALVPGAVHLAGGGVVPADVMVVGIGARPATAWLAGTPVRRAPDGGVLVDAALRTSVDRVLAAGDVAAWPSARYGVRLRAEHWDTALHGPAVVAATICAPEEAVTYDAVPYVWSDQFGRTVMHVGAHGAADRWVWREPGDGTFAAFALAGGRLVAAVGVGRPRDVVQARRLIEQAPAATCPRVDAAVLGDAGAPVKSALLPG